MPRHPRLHVPGGFYHVTLRGNHRENIFSTAEDRQKLNAIVAEALEKYGARLHLFCWMTNHLHALLRIPPKPATSSAPCRPWIPAHVGRGSGGGYFQ